jgi:hypothetical protein
MRRSTQASNFRLNAIRRNNIAALSVEYLSILAILYGEHIDAGYKRIHDYGSMTMLEAENEIRTRTIMLQGDRLRKKRQLREEHAQNEKDMLEQLKRAQQ